MTYDALARMVSRSYPDNSQDLFTYDLNGNMLTAVNSNASLSFTYDAAGRMLSETQNGHTSQYVYNTRNNTIGMTYPGGRAIQEQYDVRGRLTAINEGGNPVVLMEYNANNRLSQRTYNNGDVTNYSYDAAGRLTKIKNLNSQLSTLNYIYDNGGNMLAKIDSINGNRSEQYQYDALHRLIDFRKGLSVAGQIPNPVRHVQYALDALGNRTTVTDNGTTTQYSHNNMNAYTAISGAINSTPQYDNNGNMTADGNHSYQYNYNNRLIAVDNGNTTTYQYDALNRRVYKKVGNTITRYYYRGQQMIEERDGNDAVEATYLYGFAIDQVLQMRRGSNNYYYHTNHLGSVCDITDAMGELVEHYDYDPYGAVTMQDATGNTITASAIGNTILFTGRELDPETGLYYYRARTMNPTLGRFMQKDPLMYVDGYNDYVYVMNNPLSFNDWNGLNKGCNQDPKDDFCKKHPVICALQGNGEIGGEACVIMGAGACLDFSAGVSAGADGAKPYFKIGGSVGFGFEASASGSVTAGGSDSRHNSSDNYWEISGGAEAGVGFGGKATYDPQSGDWSAQGTVGPVTAGGSNSSAYGGVAGGVGLGGHVGYHVNVLDIH